MSRPPQAGATVRVCVRACLARAQEEVAAKPKPRSRACLYGCLSETCHCQPWAVGIARTVPEPHAHNRGIHEGIRCVRVVRLCDPRAGCVVGSMCRSTE